MVVITFIYRIVKDNNVYYGKYNSDYFDKDHEGLNLEIEKVLLFGLNEYRRQINLPLLNQDDVTAGIISCETQVLNYITEKEIKCFDFYYFKCNKYSSQVIRDYSYYDECNKVLQEDFYVFGIKLDFNQLINIQNKNTSTESSKTRAEPKYNYYLLELQDIEN